MQKLIKDGAATEDHWVLVKEATNSSILKALPGRSLIVPLNFYRLFRDDLDQYYGEVTVWLNSDESVYDIADELDKFPLIGLNFPVFSDGRSYSNARELRETLGYTGDIRAIGDVMRDQLYYMSRCGFSSYSLRFDQDADTCLSAFSDFETGYQSSVDQPLPLFRRR